MALVIEYHEDLEYDLHVRCNGVDLLDFWRGTLSPRRLTLLLRRLPTDSMFFRKAYPDDARIAEWGPTEYLLADIFDLTYAGLAAGSKQKPEPYPRPAAVIEKKRRDDARHKALIDRYETRARAKRRGPTP